MKIKAEPLRRDDQDYEKIRADSLEYWLLPHEKEIISAEKKKLIKQHVEAALEFMKINYLWQ